MKLIVVLCCCFTMTLAQQKVKTDCNTIYLCIDSTAYNAIVSNSLIKNKLFVCRANATTTDTDAYAANYLIGKSATLEFLQPQKGSAIGDHIGDFGIEFKTRQLGNLTTILKQSNKRNFEADTTTNKLVTEDTIVPWYKELAFKENNFELSLLEYQSEYLNYLGFSPEQIAQEMTYEAYNSQRSGGQKYPRQFNKILSVTIELNSKELKSLKKFCLLNQMTKSKNSFHNKEFKIVYQLSDVKTKVREIVIEFLEPQSNEIMQLTDSLTFEIVGTTGRFIFNQ